MQSNAKVQLFPFGPLHDNRHDINRRLKPHIRTGDIFYRASDARGPFNLPFSRIVQFLTKSKYSHAAISLVRDDDVFLLEVSDQGTVLCRFIDWIDYCSTPEFSVYRLKDIPKNFDEVISQQIQEVLDLDPDYNFDFSDPDKIYCTECVSKMYQACGIELSEPQIIKKIVPAWSYPIIVFVNWIFTKITPCSLPLDKPLYFVGNEKSGMIASKYTKLIVHYFEL